MVHVLRLQALMEPLKPIQGPFISPKMPQKGEQFEVRVKHLLTPNEVIKEPESYIENVFIL